MPVPGRPVPPPLPDDDPALRLDDPRPDRPGDAQLARLPPDVRAAAFDPADRFGRHVRLRKLAEGGMGAVYIAHDTELSPAVALKLAKVTDASPGAPGPPRRGSTGSRQPTNRIASTQRRVFQARP